MKKKIFIISLFLAYIANTINVGDCTNQNIDKKQIGRKQMINKIESESEIKIPSYVDTIHIEYMYVTAIRLDLPIRTVFRLVFKESTFRDSVVSPEGAKGYMQLMPRTYSNYSKILNLDSLNLSYNYENILIGLNYLRNSYDRWKYKGYSNNDAWKRTLAEYNAGIRWVLLYHGVPPFPETIEYVNFILKEKTISEST